MTYVRSKLIAFLIFLTVVFQHFEIGLVGGTYRLTIGLLTGTLLVLIASRALSYTRLTAVWVAIIFLSSLSALAAPEFAYSSKFTSTLLLFLLTSLFITAAQGGFWGGVYRNDLVWKTIHFTLAVIVALSVGQTVTGALGSEMLFNPFGRFQFQNEYQPHLEANLLPRAQGFFLEPSYDAFVIGTLAVALLCARKYFHSTIALGLVGMAACQSATGLILFLGITVLIALKSRPGIAVPTLLASATLGVFSGGYSLTRIGSIGNVGSSGNYRLVAPLRVLGDVLVSHPLGLPLGSIYDVIVKYDLVMVGVDQTVSLDNGVYVVVYYFGWTGLILLSLFAIWTISSVLRRRDADPEKRYLWILPVWLLGSLLFSGGIMAPEFGLMTWLVIAASSGSRLKPLEEGISRDAPAHAEHRHSHVPGHPRSATNTLLS